MVNKRLEYIFGFFYNRKSFKKKFKLKFKNLNDSFLFKFITYYLFICLSMSWLVNAYKHLSNIEQYGNQLNAKPYYNSKILFPITTRTATLTTSNNIDTTQKFINNDFYNKNNYYYHNNKQKKFANQNPQIFFDSSSLKLEFCVDCDIFIGGLFPVHAPKYIRQSTKTIMFTTEIEDNNILNISSNHANSHLNHRHHNQQLNSVSSPYVDLTEEIVNELTCGEIKKERGIQRLEAMLYAIDLINNSTTLLPDLRLGVKIYDTCDRDTIALEKCINFVSDHFLLNDENIVNDFSCESSEKYGSQLNVNKKVSYFPKKKNDVIYKRKVIGVIGAASSSVSIQVANLLRLFKVLSLIYFLNKK